MSTAFTDDEVEEMGKHQVIRSIRLPPILFSPTSLTIVADERPLVLFV
jgi:hypothetical protein